MLDCSDVKRIVADITFRDWTLHVGKLGDGSYIQIRFMAPDTYTGINVTQHGRKWYISSYSIEQEVVRTAHLAIRQAMLHEVDEDFKYKGRRIFGPHIDPEALLDVSGKQTYRE